MKILILTILLTTSCSINKSLKNVNTKEVGPTSIASINLGGIRFLK
ncbi:hypothetical protein [Halobacteriovorax sp.]